MAGEQLPERDDRRDGSDQRHQPDAPRLRFDAVANLRADDATGFQAERAAVGQFVERGPQVLARHAGIQPDRDHRGRGADAVVEERRREHRHRVVVFEAVGGVHDADERGFEGRALRVVAEAFAVVGLRLGPAEQR